LADDAGGRLAGDRRQVSRLVAVPRRRSGAFLPDRCDGQLAGRSRQRGDRKRLRRSGAPRRGLPRDQLPDFGPHAQPGHRLHPRGGPVPRTDPGGIFAADRSARALGEPLAGGSGFEVFGPHALRRLPEGDARFARSAVFPLGDGLRAVRDRRRHPQPPDRLRAVMHKKTESLLYSAGGLVAALIILVLLNLVLGAARGRIDLTQGRLYTLSGHTSSLGASISYADQKLALPALAPDREALLEYDLVRAIARAAATAKLVIGVMSALPVFGMPPSPMTGGQPLEPQVFIGELRRDYTVKRVGLDPEKIDDDVKVLLVIHPRGIGERAQYALDQFVLRGGKLIAFLDPSAYFDQLGQMGGMGGGGTPSSLDRLLK